MVATLSNLAAPQVEVSIFGLNPERAQKRTCVPHLPQKLSQLLLVLFAGLLAFPSKAFRLFMVEERALLESFLAGGGSGCGGSGDEPEVGDVDVDVVSDPIQNAWHHRERI